MHFQHCVRSLKAVSSPPRLTVTHRQTLNIDLWDDQTGKKVDRAF